MQQGIIQSACPYKPVVIEPDPKAKFLESEELSPPDALYLLTWVEANILHRFPYELRMLEEAQA